MSTADRLPLMRFRVYLADDPTATPATHDLVVIPADRMRAERASTQVLPPSQRAKGARDDHPETWVLLWLWCAATRLGLTADQFEAFTERVLDYDRLVVTDDGRLVVKGTEDDDDDDDGADAVDPTTATAHTPSP